MMRQKGPHRTSGQRSKSGMKQALSFPLIQLPKQWGLRNPISAELGGKEGIHGCKRTASGYVEAIFAKQMILIDFDCNIAVNKSSQVLINTLYMIEKNVACSQQIILSS